MKVVYFEPGKKPEIREIENSLEESQKLVEGYIEVVQPFDDDDILLVCNEEGRLNNMKANRRFGTAKFSQVIFGPFFLVGAGVEDFCSLSDRAANWLVKNEWAYATQM